MAGRNVCYLPDWDIIPGQGSHGGALLYGDLICVRTLHILPILTTEVISRATRVLGLLRRYPD